MQVIKYPSKETWQQLSQRPTQSLEEIEKVVSPILDDIKLRGDAALFEYAEKFDKARISNLLVTEEEIATAIATVDVGLKNAIDIAYKNILYFHQQQQTSAEIIETSAGVFCWRKSLPIDKVGVYIPGGTAPLFSTVLMLAIPAKIAGCSEVVLCSPPNQDGKINPVILYAANLCGVHKIFKVGGAQAIAAMAYGTQTIPQVYKIFGPGNQYVTATKQLVNKSGTAIDMPAGPSEVLVIGDDESRPDFIAADLLAQAEHGIDSQVIFVTTEEMYLNLVHFAIDEQLKILARKSIAEKALENSKMILLKNLDDAIAFSNVYAPEHLILQTRNAEELANQVSNAGSVFIGHYTPESVGDYASGTNHTLPTNGFAKAYSGVSLDSFQKKITFQKMEKAGLENIGPAVELMAENEGLTAHKNAVTIRLKNEK
ncbi:MAG TPA: histidinol dehydrogenase [Chitinophagales bacterium]|nr:histidinol dehydrogenase [Chitinophagales bacterium]HNI31642.1 histidinol dehydrogenase [Chitinophagales bacterium]HNK73453.1 histidinol dehydrogenase [Chitinophagales bacterium]